jgi:hypothetical protein
VAVEGSWDRFESQTKRKYPFSKPRLQRIASTTTVKKWYVLPLGNGAASKSREKTVLYVFSVVGYELGRCEEEAFSGRLCVKMGKKYSGSRFSHRSEYDIRGLLTLGI